MLKINNIDFSGNVQEKAYKIDENAKYSTWTDANYTNHREPTRTQIKGNLELVFVEGYGRTFSEFLAAIEAAKTGLLLPLTLTVNNTAEEKTINAYYELSASAPRKISEGRTFRKIKMTIEEQ